jgi:hypothetical protein
MATPSTLSAVNVAGKFVGFIDILGFSSRVLTHFSDSLAFYSQILESTSIVNALRPGLSISIYSDSFLLVSSELGDMIAVVQALQMQTLFNDCLVRGGIAWGQHAEKQDGKNLYIVSEALVKAATVEKQIKYPCVALHSDVSVSDGAWGAYERNLDRGLLYFGGVRLVNPCNIGWGQSAGTRVRQLLASAPEHREKFEWFLELHEAIFSPIPMVPPRLIATADAT